MFGLSELAVILIVVIAVLAAKKLPDLARSAGKSARILKAESRAMKDEQEPTTPRVIQGETASPGHGPGTAPDRPQPSEPRNARDTGPQRPQD
ncbi:Sec-independent protein translocase TatA [Streptomyces sp. SA15]|uniref:twin-arginine translocase TatA/TatE family subunit n=1 Tax=Streptomyces sp. SA15 TaxID=934019 RepID=UPI000BAF64FC|nr:twin-arginine translocase TatA/TatE family subunit [Streptomyces sp. SA15]PAZ14366.1 Sec-independent protein translocase TatA [Streptomyces sp. SA15]